LRTTEPQYLGIIKSRDEIECLLELFVCFHFFFIVDDFAIKPAYFIFQFTDTYFQISIVSDSREKTAYPVNRFIKAVVKGSKMFPKKSPRRDGSFREARSV